MKEKISNAVLYLMVLTLIASVMYMSMTNGN